MINILKSVEENTTKYNRYWLRDLILKKKRQLRKDNLIINEPIRNEKQLKIKDNVH